MSLRQPYRVLNEIVIDSQALLHNFQSFQTLNPQASIAPVLKANAYGHGLALIGHWIDTHLKVPYLCVDSLYEAYELKKAGLQTPLLIIGYTHPSNFSVWKKLPFAFPVFDLETLKALNTHQPGAKIHLKIDTGMHRLGLQPNQFKSFIHTLKQCRTLKVEGIYTHLSQADNPQRLTFTQNQLRQFKSAVRTFEASGFHFKYKHAAATAGATYIKDPDLNLIRLGLGFYGYSPFDPHIKSGRLQRHDLKPALTLKSQPAQLKAIAPGSKVSYSGTYTSKHHEQIAILPLGYNEGLPRVLSNQGIVSLKDGTLCPIIGNICMNMTIIKIPRTAKTQVNDPVTVISPQTDQPNNIYSLALMAKTIPYEILTGLHPSIRRRLI
jgi:alanine racemase